MSVSDIDGSRSVGYMCFKNIENAKENKKVDMGMVSSESKQAETRLMKQASKCQQRDGQHQGRERVRSWPWLLL